MNIAKCPITQRRVFLQKRIESVRSIIKVERCEIEKETLHKYLAKYKQQLKELDEDPLDLFCKTEPWSDECRLYDN